MLVRTGGIIEPGMSGSPILGDDGRAVSLVAANDTANLGALAMILHACLPGWMLSRCPKRASLTERGICRT
jgi:hypothetical protein